VLRLTLPLTPLARCDPVVRKPETQCWRKRLHILALRRWWQYGDYRLLTAAMERPKRHTASDRSTPPKPRDLNAFADPE